MSTNSKDDPFWKAVTFGPQEPRDPFPSAATKKRLAKLGEHKDVLLAHLQDAYKRGSKTDPFDAKSSWSRIEALEILSSEVEQVAKEDMSATECKKRYQEIADILKRARKMIDGAMWSPTFATGLINAWWKGTTEFAEADGRLVDMLYIENEFEKVKNGLAILEQAAAQAFSEVQTVSGRPRGRNGVYVHLLADLYRNCTGSKPGAGHGPFARFVRTYLTAVGLNIEDETIVEIIKEVRTQSQQKVRRASKSPFEG